MPLLVTDEERLFREYVILITASPRRRRLPRRLFIVIYMGKLLPFCRDATGFYDSLLLSPIRRKCAFSRLPYAAGDFDDLNGLALDEIEHFYYQPRRACTKGKTYDKARSSTVSIWRLAQYRHAALLHDDDMATPYALFIILLLH